MVLDTRSLRTGSAIIGYLVLAVIFIRFGKAITVPV